MNCTCLTVTNPLCPLHGDPRDTNLAQIIPFTLDAPRIPWASAGGPDECGHGYAFKGELGPCPTCFPAVSLPVAALVWMLELLDADERALVVAAEEYRLAKAALEMRTKRANVLREAIAAIEVSR